MAADPPSLHTRELAFHRCYSPRTVFLADVAWVADRRWTVEENFHLSLVTGLRGDDQRRAGLG